MIRLLGESGHDTGAWFGPAHYELSLNQITLHSPLLPPLCEPYPVMLPPYPRLNALSASNLATKQIKESEILPLVPPSSISITIYIIGQDTKNHLGGSSYL